MNPHFKDTLDEILLGLSTGRFTPKSIERKRALNSLDEILVSLVESSTGVTGTIGPTGPPGNTAQCRTHIHVGRHPDDIKMERERKKREEQKRMDELESGLGLPSSIHRTKWVPGESNIIDLGEGQEPIIGFRDFLVVDTIVGMYLMSRNQDLWRHRIKNVATCGANSPLGHQKGIPHDAPHSSCDCGIYAYDKPNHPSLKQTDGIVWAEIALWGDVYLCETGYRGEFAYPLSLFVKDNGLKKERRVAAELELNYGVPVYLVKEREGKTAADIMGEMIAAELNQIPRPGIDYLPPGYVEDMERELLDAELEERGD